MPPTWTGSKSTHTACSLVLPYAELHNDIMECVSHLHSELWISTDVVMVPRLYVVTQPQRQHLLVQHYYLLPWQHKPNLLQFKVNIASSSEPAVQSRPPDSLLTLLLA